MGEIAEMMLDGTLCEGCGEYMGEADGFPRYCSQNCANDRGIDFNECDDDDEDEKITLDDVIGVLNIEILLLEDIANDLKNLNNPKKARALLGLIKNLKSFSQSLGGNNNDEISIF